MAERDDGPPTRAEPDSEEAPGPLRARDEEEQQRDRQQHLQETADAAGVTTLGGSEDLAAVVALDDERFVLRLSAERAAVGAAEACRRPDDEGDREDEASQTTDSTSPRLHQHGRRVSSIDARHVAERFPIHDTRLTRT
jgi:hypothetical protein